jgi:hypothetical protein
MAPNNLNVFNFRKQPQTGAVKENIKKKSGFRSLRVTVTYVHGEAELGYTQTLTYLIEVEGEIPCHRAVEARLEERCPALAEAVRSSLVMLADTGHPGIHCL